ncbi:DUF2157 domain-containing protein [Sphingomonas sp. So64.6b]|uniref:DUF2157 domain-containing protein n=1 Tax=Sphingomonas sp. So64.6b TaxID=2997354 RepID=UPI00160485CF|nr:DUF2157 domain-containing protein [Sphingomonas sp. So64.6b]QNA85005.1 DUF2157 domain-containing protein [Sphingomonas sp. So64.6b]
MSERKLKAWQQAGLIDADTAARIQAWESTHTRPLGVWAMVGLGALAIGLGIVSVVASNWDAIPGEVRLGLHFALMAGVAALLWWRLSKASGESDYVGDAMLFVAAVLGLTFFAHIGQVYQTSSPLWQPLLVWLAIFSPLLLSFGRGWPVAGLWMAGVLGTAWSHADDYGHLWLLDGRGGEQLPYPVLYWGLIASPPMIVAALAAVMRGHSTRPIFWRLLEQVAIVTILIALSIIFITRGWSGQTDYVTGSSVIQSLFLAGAAGMIYLVRRTRTGEASAAILCVGAVLHFVMAMVRDFRGAVDDPWIPALLFLALWGAVAGGALYAGWRWVFQCAIGVIAVRIIILSFELSDDLLGSGVSLIASGLFAMLVAWASVRISRRYAPRREAEA